MRAAWSSRPIAVGFGTPLAGYGLKPERRAESVHDALCARALVLDDGTTRAALVSCDVISLGHGIVRQIRDALAKIVPPEHLLTTATHSHSSPTAGFFRHWGALEPAFVQNVQQAVVAAVTDACERLAPARIAHGERQLDGVAMNRVHADGEIDHTLRVLALQSEAGPARLMHFAVHPVEGDTAGRAISRESPGFAVDACEAAGAGFGAFFQGCCGDINPLRPFRGLAEARATGARIGSAAAALHADAPVDGAIRCLARTIELPLDWEWARREAEDYLYRREVAPSHRWLAATTFMRDWAAETLGLVAAGPPPTLRTELQAIAIGDRFVALALPGEIYALFARRIREASPFAATWCIGYANDNIGYIVEERDYAEGTYGAHMTPKLYGFAPFRTSAGDNLVREASALLQELATAKV